MSEDLEFEKQGAVQRIHELHAGILDSATGGATVQERDTWAPKEAAARAYVAGSPSPSDTLMIETEANLSSQNPLALANYIVYKADQFKILVGETAGLRAKALAAIQACQTVEEVDRTISEIEVQTEIEFAEFIARISEAQT